MNRRAFIVNYRPKAIIALESAQGFDHGRSGITDYNNFAIRKSNHTFWLNLFDIKYNQDAE
jgi:hypothetical protein